MASSKVSKISLILSVCANVLAIVVIVLLLLRDGKKNLDVTMSDATYVYDGTEKSLKIDKLPNVCTVDFEYNNQKKDGWKNVGEHKVKANINGQGIFNNKTLESTLKITPRDLKETEKSYFGLSNMFIKYDGNSHTIKPVHDTENVVVTYDGQHEFTNVGVYSIKGTVKNNSASGNTNYINELTFLAELTIYGDTPPPVYSNPGKLTLTDNSMVIFDMDAQIDTFYNDLNTGNSAFKYHDNGIEKNVIKNNIKEIEFTCKDITEAPEDYLFNFCYGMTNLEVANITLPQNITRVNAYFLQKTFNGCSNLRTIGEGFLLPNTNNLEIHLEGNEQLYFLESTFSGCTSLEALPSQFTLPNKLTLESNAIVTSPPGYNFMYKTFLNCKNIEYLPSGFRLPSEIHIEGNKNWSLEGFMTETFMNCEKLKNLPNGFDLIHNITTESSTFTMGLYAKGIYARTFYGCSALETLPSSFHFPNRTINSIISTFFTGDPTTALTHSQRLYFMFEMFANCTSLTSDGGTSETIWGDGDASWDYYDYRNAANWLTFITANANYNQPTIYNVGMQAFYNTPLITSFDNSTNPNRSFYPGLVLTIKRNS